jgi:PKHD-type hydroxylase
LDYQILTLLEPEEVRRLSADVLGMKFVDGKATAHGKAQSIKFNLQSERPGAEPTSSDDVILGALQRSREFQSFAIPKRILLPLFSKYEPGMNYGSHVDAAVMNSSAPLRTDFAMTLFLVEPETYDGGELVIETSAGEQEIKLPAGDAIVYPASTIHRVMPVLRGLRLVAVTWIQSAIRDAAMRDVLRTLREALEASERGQHPTLLLSKAYQNLMRLTVDY